MNTELERQAERIFDQTLDSPTSDRPAAIAAACGGNAALLARVQALVDANRAGGFLANMTHHSTDSDAGSAPVGEKPGDTIGRYKLLEKIGEGGFGVVFTAEQQKPVRRLVAVKVIKLGMDTREVVARFEAERQALAMMDHPNIARVLDVGSTDTGRPYFVMELVRGSPVTEYADKHKLSTRDRVALAAQICRAVQHAHSKGVIHRDLKPSNVLVTVTDDKPVPKVIDFGIAKATQSRLTELTLHTAHRQLIGTPQYMSPEQADSDGSDIDTRTDVYSLGVLLYELLVGSTPLDARQLRSAAYEAMRKMIRDTDSPRPATRLQTMAGDAQAMIASSRSTDVRRLADSVKGELDWIVMKALEKDRTRRYDTAAAFADDLNRYLAGEAVLAGPVSGTYRLKKTLKRYRAAVIVGGAIAACLLLGAAGTTWGLVAARHQRTVALANAELAGTERQKALAEKQIAEDKAAEARATLDFVTKDIFAKASPGNAMDDRVSKVLVTALITPALRTMDQRFAGQPLLRASIQEMLANTLLDLGRADLAEPQARAALDARRHVQGEEAPQTLTALKSYALAVFARGRRTEAEQLLKQAWDARRRTQGDDHPDTLAALMAYALALHQDSRFADAERLYKQAWDARRRLLGDNHPDTLAALQSYGWAILNQNRNAEAERLLKQAWDSSRQALGDEHPQTLACLDVYAMSLAAQGRQTEAEQLLQKVWDADRRLLGENHPDTMMAFWDYVATLENAGRHEESEQAFKQLWEQKQRVYGDQHPATLSALNCYGVAVEGRGRYAEAERMFKQAWDASRVVQGESHPDTLTYLDDYAGALYYQGHLAEAERLYRQAYETRRQTQGDDHLDTLWDLNYVANTAAEQGRYAEAEGLWKGAWDTRRRVQGETNPDTLNALHCFGWVVSIQGRYADAEPLLKQAWDARRQTLGEEHTDTLRVETDYAFAIDGLGRHADAEQLLKQVWDIRRRVEGDDNADTLLAMADYALDVDWQGRHADAEPLLKACWDARRKKLGDDDAKTIWAEFHYAAVVDAQGGHAQAEPLLRDAADRYRLHWSEKNSRSNSLSALGQCLVSQQKWTEAEQVLRESLAFSQLHPAGKRGPIIDAAALLNQCLIARRKPAIGPSTQP